MSFQKKVFDGAKDALIYTACQAAAKKTLQIVYNGLMLLSKKEAKKRADRCLADKK